LVKPACVTAPQLEARNEFQHRLKQTSETILDQLTKPNHIALLRHALAPGTSDPNHFDLNDCSTQRNLNDDGRDQARRIGQLFRSREIEQLNIYSSQWCRCQETAELIALGKVTAQPLLNSFFENRSIAEKQTLDLKSWLQTVKYDHPVLLVTHQVNITSLTGVYPSSGELVIVKLTPAGELTVIGTHKTLSE